MCAVLLSRSHALLASRSNPPAALHCDPDAVHLSLSRCGTDGRMPCVIDEAIQQAGLAGAGLAYPDRETEASGRHQNAASSPLPPIRLRGRDLKLAARDGPRRISLRMVFLPDVEVAEVEVENAVCVVVVVAGAGVSAVSAGAAAAAAAEERRDCTAEEHEQRRHQRTDRSRREPLSCSRRVH